MNHNTKEFYYLLGAGASLEIIPLVADFSNDMQTRTVEAQLSVYVNKPENNHNTNRKFLDEDIKKEFNIMNSVALEFDAFGSPDIFAKYLFVNSTKNNSKLKLLELKHYLTLFIQLKEGLANGGKPDQRYFEFISQILNSEGQLPKNLIIANWNYDNQVEIALNKFRMNDKWNTDLYDGSSKISSSRYKFIEYKLNGGAYFKNPSKQKTYLFEKIVNGAVNNDSFNSIMQNLYRVKDYGSGIKFAFENESSVFEKLIEKIEKTNNTVPKYLTIIGYSFPVFNRNFDQRILQCLLSRGLRKIYIQDPNPDEIKRKVRGFFSETDLEYIDKIIEPIAANFVNTKQDHHSNPRPYRNFPFHIPMEFTPEY